MNTSETLHGDPSLYAIAATVTELWREVLQHTEPIQPTDNFFSIGGDSLTMMLFLFRAHETFGVELPAAAMLEATDLSDLCHTFREAIAQASSGSPDAVPAHPQSL